MHQSAQPATRTQIGVALGIVYLVWGSTYLAIRIAVATVPPFLMTGGRFLVAGCVLYALARARGVAKPSFGQWKSAAIVGALLFLIGNGGVCWAERVVPSNQAALMVATTPLWMVLLDWLGFGVTRPKLWVVGGLGLGFLGAGILVAPGMAGGGHIDPAGACALLIGMIAWATGSLYARRATLPDSLLMAPAMQMVAGGTLLLIASGMCGEWNGLASRSISTHSLLAMGYLCVFGSMIGFSTYAWLLRSTSIAVVSTYAYINPLVAVLLGSLLAGEKITMRTGFAGAAILAAVVMINSQPRPGLEEPAEPF